MNFVIYTLHSELLGLSQSSPVQKPWQTGTSPAREHWDFEASDMQGEAERAGTVQPGEQKDRIILSTHNTLAMPFEHKKICFFM